MLRPRTGRRLGILLAAAAVTASSTALAVPAEAHTRHGNHPLGQRSLATVLATDGNHLDRNWNDFDILDKVVHLVLAAKPDSPVAVLADGSTRLTAFLPTDRAFRRLAHSLTGHWYRTEGGALNAIASAPGVDADLLESVLLYHVVPGARITYRQARHADGAVLTTALSGASITVRVKCHRVTLRDLDPDNRNPRVLRRAADINKGNRQIAHGIDRVLRPINL
jgi:uncharacterized surface protein with fasciclin (FAS1) repeats